MTVELFAENQASTTVTSGGTTAPASGTVEMWTVASSSMFPAALSTAPGTQFHVADVATGFTSEIIAVTNVSGTTWTVTRGAEGTTPVAHSAGFTIDQVVTTGFLGNVQTSLNVLSPIFSGGADPTGANDSSAAFQAALNAVPSTGGVVGVPAGVYKVGTALTVPTLLTYLAGAGRGVTTINSHVTGDCIRMYGGATANSQAAGGITGITIDGTSAGTGSSGIHVGDMFHPVFDLAVQNFTGASSIGAHFDNNYSWMEQATGKVYASNCTSLVVFDNSANTSGGATGSYDRTVMDFFLNNDAAGPGVTFQNGAFVEDGRLGIYGNFSAGGTAAYPVLTLTGSNVADGYSLLADSVLNIGVELAGTTATVPSTITFGSSGNNVIRRCHGVIDFGAHNAFAAATNATNSFSFEGPVNGDTTLRRTQQGTNAFNAGTGLSNGGNIATVNDVITVSPTSNLTGMIMPKWGSALGTPTKVTVINRSSVYSITMAASGTSFVATGTQCVILPDTSLTFYYDTFLALWVPQGPGGAGLPLALQASTGTSGYTLVNGTGNIITWTTPNDGGLHRIAVFASIHVSSTETGGVIALTYTLPDGTASGTHTLLGGAQSAGDGVPSANYMVPIEANTTVTVKQSTALTGGTAIAWAEIWGS